MKKNGKLFGIFNIVDIIIILLVIAAAALAFKLFIKEDDASQTAGKTYTYVVEGSEVLEETANMPVIGGNAYESSSSAYLGVVTDVRTEPYTETVFSAVLGAYQKTPVNGYCNIYLTIEGQGEETEQDITVEGTTVKVGMELNVKGKGYAFKGIVVEVRDGE